MVCEVCGRQPATSVVVRRHVGMLVLQRFYKVHVTVCREHGLELWRRWTGRTILQGWWGYISFFANIFTILMNLVSLTKLLRIGSPQHSSAGVGATDDLANVPTETALID